MVETTVPVLYRQKEECCGCSACLAVCPVQAITMKQDEEGFFYPEINKEKCISCQQCVKVCNFR
jgi:formate hydrogenlyase subunit 6/NADH:ubiquinone oxidoreductase subunit I